MEDSNLQYRLKGITFDLWGTLFRDDYYPPDQPSFRHMRTAYFRERLKECGIAIAPDQAEQAYQHARKVFDGYWKQQKAFDAPLGIRAMLDFVGVTVPEEVFQALVRYFQEVVNQTTLKLTQGAKECLKALYGHYRLAIISDTGWVPGRVIRQQLERNGILPLFRAIIFSDEVGRTKPHPSLFHAAAHALRLQPSDCLHVGDLPFTDVSGARAAGFRTAWLFKPEYQGMAEKEPYRPDLVLHNLTELRAILRV